MTQETKGKETCKHDDSGIQAYTGTLVALKTTLETRARESFISVYVTSVPVKQASGTLE